MQAVLATAKAAVNEATNVFVQAGALKAETIPAMIDKTLNDEEQQEKLRGSIIKTQLAGVEKLFAVPAGGKVWETTRAGVQKIAVIDKWSGAVALKKLSELGTLQAWWEGAITFPDGAGSRAGLLEVGGMKVSVLPGAEGANIDSVNMLNSGVVTTVGLDNLMTQLEHDWQPCDGLLGGLAGFPAGDGLPDKTVVDTDVGLASVLAGMSQAQAALAAAAFKAIGLVSAADEASPARLGGFLAAAAGEPAAGALFAVGLATGDGDTARREAGQAVGKDAIKLLQRIAAQLNAGLVEDVAKRVEPLTRLNVQVGGQHIGNALSVAVLAAGGSGAPAAAGGGAQTGAATGAAAAAAAAALGEGGEGGPAPPPPGAGGGGLPPEAARDIIATLQLDPEVEREVRESVRRGQEKAAQRSSGRAVTFVHLQPAGAPIVSDTEVIKAISRATGNTVKETAAALEAERAVKHLTGSIFKMDDDDSHAEAAVLDLAMLQKTAAEAAPERFGPEALVRRGRPADWKEAARRVHEIIQEARREMAARAAAKSAASSTAGADDRNIAGMFKSATAAKLTEKHPTSVDSAMLTPIAKSAFARQEEVATKGANPVLEAQRLCALPGELGEATRAFMFSDGSVRGAMPKGIVISVVDAREKLHRWIMGQLETVVGTRRVPEASDAIDRLATAILTIRARTTTGEPADDEHHIFPLAVKLLGGTPPEEDLDGTEDDTIGEGTWGTTLGNQSRVDVPTAMGHLAYILAAVHGTVGGGEIGKAAAGRASAFGPSATSDGLGLTNLARRACGRLTDEKVIQTFRGVFADAQHAMVRMRTRPGEGPVNLVAIIGNAGRRRIDPLVDELRAENAVGRAIAKHEGGGRGAGGGAGGGGGGGRKSPRPDDGGEDGGVTPGSKRAKKRVEFVEKQQAARAEKAAAKEAAATQRAANSAAAGAVLAGAPTGSGGGFSFAPGSIAVLASKEAHDGAVEALAQLYIARNPSRVQREQQPCPFVAIRHGAGSDALCKEGQKEGFGKCAQCKGWAATARDKRVPFHADDVAKVKAACVARLQGQFSGMQVA